MLAKRYESDKTDKEQLTRVAKVDVQVVKTTDSATELGGRDLRHEHGADAKDDAGGYATNDTSNEKHLNVLGGGLQDSTNDCAA
jgi:hypothetical protein